MKKLFAVTIIVASVLLFSTGASAEWSINALSPPDDMEKVSNLSNTVQVVEITDNNNDPVTESRLESDPAELSFIYNKTNGFQVEMEHLHSGYYYASYPINSSFGLTTEYELLDSSSNGFEKNVTEEYDVGNMTVNIITDFSEEVDPSEPVDIRINVTDDEGNFENQANVDFYVTNVSWNSDFEDTLKRDFSGDGNKDHYGNLDQDFNLEYSSKYIIHALATNNSLGYKNPYGSESFVFETLPDLKADIESIGGDGCEDIQGSNPDIKCERGSEIDTEVSITSSTANDGNLTMFIYNKSSGEWDQHKKVGMESSGENFVGNITVPDLNTSAYSDEFKLEFEVSNEDLKYGENRTIKYVDYSVEDISNSVTQPPGYDLKIEATKAVTPTTLEADRLNGYVNITEPDGDQLTVFNLSDMSFDSDTAVFSNNINLPYNSETGVYDKSIYVENIYGEGKNLNTDFRVENLSKAFDVEPTEISRDIDRQKEYISKINFTNFGATNVTVNPDDDLEDIVEVNNGSSINIEEDTEEEVNITFNISTVNDYSGDIEFNDNDSSYSEEVEVDLNSPVCTNRNGSFCVTGNLDFTITEQGGSASETVTLHYLGPKSHEQNIAPQFNGNISQYAEVSPDVVQINSENSTFDFQINVSSSVPGDYSGNLDFEGIEVPMSLESNFEGTDVSFTASDIDRGAWPEGRELSADVEIENTGSGTITTFEANSGNYDTEVDYDNIEPGNTQNITVTLTEIESAGTVELTGSNSQSSDSQTIEVNINVIQNLADEKSNLQDEISNLDSQVDSAPLQGRLDEASVQISEMETAYNQGDYDRAQEIYNEVSTTLDEVERETQFSSGPDTNRTDPGSSPGTPDPGSSSEGGGSGLLPLIAGVLIILLIGFVAFTSIVPEEGDPLYNVLGK